MRSDLLTLLFCPFFLLASCAPMPGPDKTASGALLGAGWGAGTGAIIGNQVGSPGAGVAIGAGMAAASGIMSGIGLDLEEGAQLDTRRRVSSAQALSRYNRARLEELSRTEQYRSDSQLNQAFAQVFFDQGRASLKQSSVSQLQHLSKSLRQYRYGSYNVVLRGFSTDSEDEILNKELINARLESVKTMLLAHGLPESSLAVEFKELKKEDAYQKGVLLNADSEPFERYNNRVELYVSYF